MASASITARAAYRTFLKRTVQVRVFSTNRKDGYTWDEPMHPNYGIDSVKPPKHWAMPPDGKESPILAKLYQYLCSRTHMIYFHILLNLP